MTIRQALARCDALQKSTVSQAQKIRWLSELEGQIHLLILDGREGERPAPFAGFTDSTDLNTPLTVPEPFDSVYLYFLLARIHFANGEIQRYNNANALFHNAWLNYANYVNRKILPRACCFRYF